MPYSIKSILHNHVQKNGLQSIKIQVIYNRTKIYLPTDYKVKVQHFVNGIVKLNPRAKQINFNLKSKMNEIEAKLLAAIQANPYLSVADLKHICENGVISNSITITDWVKEILRLYKLSHGRMKHYLSICNKLNAFKPGISLAQCDAKMLQSFETYLRSTNIDNNTIQSNMQLIKSILNKAVNSGLLDAGKLKGYKNVKYIQKIPDYLTKSELEQFKKFIIAMSDNNYRKAGLFFLLSCYTGYRISDLMSYERNKVIKDDSIIIRAKKNKQIVAMLIYPRLQEIIDLIDNTTLCMSEQTMRNYVKSIAKMCGFNRKIKVHTGRHTFGMMLANEGFSQEEAAELMGDTIDVVRTYYRISNPLLRERIKQKLF